MLKSLALSQIIVLFSLFYSSHLLLYPQRNELRRADALDGLWTFVAEPPNSNGVGFTNAWAAMDLSQFQNATVMPVPSAFNDLSVDKELREHVGWVWYQIVHYLHQDLLPKCVSVNGVSICKSRVSSSLYFESVNYMARVFVNGHEVVSHYGGHLPFEASILPSIIDPKQPSRLVVSVAVNNTLSSATIPPGRVKIMEVEEPHQTIVRQTPDFDFFHYAGILRSVHIVHMPISHITQAHLEAIVLKDGVGVLSFALNATELNSEVDGARPTFQIFVYEQSTLKLVSEIHTPEFSGFAKLKDVAKWWPRGYGDPNLYVVEINYVLLIDGGPLLLDIYRDTVGFRTVTFDENNIYINYKKFYCIGFGMHEESTVRGRGFDRVFMTKDLNMLEWLGGNCYRTSHYPYSEERAREADRRGIAVITEAPAVGISNFTEANCRLHASIITEMIQRDSNRPSVIMWSVANEPTSSSIGALLYFRNLTNHVRKLDRSRPVTAVLNAASGSDNAAISLDVIGVNRYYGWYVGLDETELINQSLIFDVKSWHTRFQKPVFIAEYGAEAIPGLSEDPPRPFSEQYQLNVLRQTHVAFDELRRSDLLTGEMIWNFADFMTGISRERVAGNHKGVLTRDRKPKASAYLIRKRYTEILDQIKTMHHKL